MNAAIARAPVQIYDVNPEQPSDIFVKRSYRLFRIDVTDLDTNMGNNIDAFIALRGGRVSDWKWRRKVTAIT